MADAIQVLEGAHRDLQTLFERVSSPDEDRAAVLQELISSMIVHLNVEKEVLVPVLRDRVEEGGALADEMSAEHDRTEEILTLLERRKVNSPDVPGLVTDLLDLTDHHVATADSKVLPGLRASLDDRELADLGTALTSDERSTLTHSHPLLPDRGPVASVTRKVAEVVDHVRDRTTDVGRTNS